MKNELEFPVCDSFDEEDLSDPAPDFQKALLEDGTGKTVVKYTTLRRQLVYSIILHFVVIVFLGLVWAVLNHSIVYNGSYGVSLIDSE